MTKHICARCVASWALWILAVVVMAVALSNAIDIIRSHRPEADLMRAVGVGIAGFAAYLASRFLSPYEDEAPTEVPS